MATKKNNWPVYNKQSDHPRYAEYLAVLDYAREHPDADDAYPFPGHNLWEYLLGQELHSEGHKPYVYGRTGDPK